MCNIYLKKSITFLVFLCFLLCVFPSLILVFFPFLCSFKKESGKHVGPALEPREVNRIWDACFGWNLDLLTTTAPRLAAMVMRPCLMTSHAYTMKNPSLSIWGFRRQCFAVTNSSGSKLITEKVSMKKWNNL